MSMLLKSWAMPPASAPTASIFWACRSCASSSVALALRLFARRDVRRRDSALPRVAYRRTCELDDARRRPGRNQDDLAGCLGPALERRREEPVEGGTGLGCHQQREALAPPAGNARVPSKRAPVRFVCWITPS